MAKENDYDSDVSSRDKDKGCCNIYGAINACKWQNKPKEHKGVTVYIVRKTAEKSVEE